MRVVNSNCISTLQLNSSGPVARFDTMPDMQSELTEQAKKLSISDRINLVEEI
jgi:hypothetical protein